MHFHEKYINVLEISLLSLIISHRKTEEALTFLIKLFLTITKDSVEQHFNSYIGVYNMK